MDDWKKVVRWYSAQEAQERLRVQKTNWLWRAAGMLVALFVCVSTGYTAYHLAVWIGTGSEWAGIISLLVFSITVAAQRD
jgi:hypothetical protein